MSEEALSRGRAPRDYLNNLKGRIGEALVESILSEAGYTVCRSGRESQVPLLIATGESDFLPDFLAWKPADVSSDGRCVRWPASDHSFLSIEVKFRSELKGFLRPSTVDPFFQAAQRWPGLFLVLVTDRPDQGRSCFQLLDLRGYDPDTPLAPIDLHEADTLGIDKAITDRYEGLAKQIFLPLREKDPERKPSAKVEVGYGASLKTRIFGQARA
jgi:hypothetical protein